MTGRRDTILDMPSAKSILQTLHTVRHLRAGQILAQLAYRSRRLIERPERWQPRGTPPIEWGRTPIDEFLAPGVQANRAETVKQGRFEFLNRAEDLGWPPRWSCDELPKLWQYNLHYFEYLWALDLADARTVVLDWIRRHDLGKDRVGWEPYPTSLRLMNWCCVLPDKFRQQTDADDEFRRLVFQSSFKQAEWLSRHLETHLLGNHLLENGAALAMVGARFDGPAAERWLRVGKRILAEQLPEQVLADGGHFERSPMYHSRVLYLTLALINSGEPELMELVAPTAARMLDALRPMCHPDGQIALFNDSALGIYNEPQELLQYAVQLPVLPQPPDFPPQGPFALPETGYYGARSRDGDYVICDAGPIGPDYLPGHAHGDMLSFELTLRGHRVIVDSGVYDYVPGEMRAYCRSTRAHNTVEIEGQDQCEFWGAFRVARRGRPSSVTWQVDDDGFRLSAEHDGYRRLAGGPRHTREFTWQSSGFGTLERLTIKDDIVSFAPVRAVSRLHLHWSCQIATISSQNWVEVTYPAGRFSIRFFGEGTLSTEPSWYCPEFGKKIPNQAITFAFSESDARARFQIEPS